MGALVAAVHKKGANAVPSVFRMLGELIHRGTDAHGIATPNSVTLAASLEEITTEPLDSSIILGHNLSRFQNRDKPQPIVRDDFALAFEGRIFPTPDISEVEKVAEALEADPYGNARKIIEEFDGAYTFVIACADTLIAGRDSLGMSPFYYGENKTTWALASEQKALWAIGVEDPKSFPPGNVAVIDEQGFSFEVARTLTPPPAKPRNMESATQCLEHLLLESLEERVSDLDRVAVAFSGGLDSSVIAALAKRCGVEVHLFSVGLAGQPEVRLAERAARELELPLHLQTYTEEHVESSLPKVLWLIEEPNVMKASIAIPISWVAEASSNGGFQTLLTGLGGDELFGGYCKYLRAYERGGVDAVRDAQFHDVKMSCRTNFERDEKVSSFQKIELRLPFMDSDVVNFALGVPASLNIHSPEDRLRKRVLRRTARRLGLSSSIANRAKKAIQYATGVSKALRRLAKKEKMSPKNYVEEIFEKTFLEEAERWQEQR